MLPAAETCTKEEFFVFLANWRRQALGNPGAVRSALLLRQRALGLETFTATFEVIKACVGATGDPGPEKVQIGRGMLEEFCRALAITDVVLCHSCPHTITALRQEICDAARLLFAMELRPGNPKEWRREHISENGGVMKLLVRLKQRHKAEREGEWVEVPHEVENIFRRRMETGERVFLFSRCVSSHLSEALKRVSVRLHWPKGLVVSPHSLRHGHFGAVEKKVRDTVSSIVTMVSGSTVSRYARKNGDRKKEKGGGMRGTRRW